ncbi:uncharacterized protein B0P05DRAFT_561613 [Gilbertella persicaria]|uniref:uncharacterized protein n=1 Tax=Gilbertella persicaria TaxID=101096 RepID=UPI002220C1A1|nr:uncharacterized protein B0P05DRAFT_561613 [Gilbertella persicaria]KAI8053699.1 hypothetical protein B0P05DRAFT_561613 [Gilbertella persicaria]
MSPVERPFSPPPTPASVSSMFSTSSQQSSQHQGSRFLQKYDISRQTQSHNGAIPSRGTPPLSRENTRTNTSNGFPFSQNASPTSSQTLPQQRSTSQRSLSTETSSVPSIPTSTMSSISSSTNNSGKSIKLPNFRLRQGPSYGSDTEMTVSSSTSSKLTSNSKSSSSFWKGSSSSTKKSPHMSESKSTKSEGSGRIPFIY